MENIETNKINLRSEDIQEILGRVPAWLTRFGSLVVLVALMLIVAVSAIVKYPDVVEAPLEISNTFPPIPLYAKIGGNIEAINVENNQAIKQGQLLGILQNAADENAVLLIESKLDTFIKFPSKVKSIQFPANPELGRLQSSYSNFLSSFQDFVFFDNQNLATFSSAHIQTQINQLQSINHTLTNQQSNCFNELNNLANNYNTDLKLLNNGIISQRDFDKTATTYIQQQSACESINVQIKNNELKVQELQMQMFGFTSTDKQEGQAKFVLLKENANALLSDINLWKEQFLVIAPVDGIVSLNAVWSNKQYINANEEILSIVQLDNALKVFADIEAKDIAKARPGQKVNIRLDAYQYLEYGLVQGKVKSISSVPRNNIYRAEIALDNGLITTYGKELSFAQGMQGSIEIVSKQRSLLSRIFDKFKYLVSKKYQST